MKVTDPQQPVNDPDVSVSDADVHTDDKKVSHKSDQDEPSPFSRVLAKKREAKQESAETKGVKRTEKNVEGAAPALVQEPTRFGQPIPSIKSAPLLFFRLAVLAIFGLWADYGSS